MHWMQVRICKKAIRLRRTQSLKFFWDQEVSVPSVKTSSDQCDRKVSLRPLLVLRTALKDLCYAGGIAAVQIRECLSRSVCASDLNCNPRVPANVGSDPTS